MRCSGVLLALLGLVSLCAGAKILVLVPFAAKSHAILFDLLTAELGKRGHQMTLVTAFKQPKPLPNVTEVVIPDFMSQMMKEMNMSMLDNRNRSTVIGSLFFFPQISYETCNRFLKDPLVKTQLLDSDEKFDLIMGEAFLDEGILAGFAYKHKAPLLPLGTSASFIWTDYMVGNPSPPAYVPNLLLGYSTKMTFMERLINTVVSLITELSHRYIHLRIQNNLMHEYFGADLPHISDIITNTSLTLINHHFSLGSPRPYVPNMIEIGGFHFGPPKKLPEDLEKYMSESKNGVILFSMGSNLKSTMLPPEKIQMFMDGFAKLKQNVIWKFENESLPGRPKNVKISKWLPQSDLLAHPNLKLFITHGGLLSTIEAVYRGVPIVGIPMFAEQPKNMKEAEEAGIGRKMNYEHITPDSLAEMVNEVIDNPKYREAVQHKSALLRDRPLPPLETAVYWVEYVLRHKGAPHLRSSAQDLAWYQLHLLDVFAVLAIAASAVLAVQFYTVRCVYRKFCSKSKVPAAPKVPEAPKGSAAAKKKKN